MKRGLRKAAALGLSTCLALTSLAGCSKKEEAFDTQASAITVNGEAISAGLVKFMCHYTQAYTESMYNSYIGENSFNIALDEAGTTLGDMVIDSSVEELKEMVLAEQKMEEYGVSLTDDENAAIDAAAAEFIAENDEEVLTLMAADEATVARYLELVTIQNKMEEAMGADVDTEVSDEEAAQRKIEYAYFAAETEAETEEETGSETEVTTEAESAADTEVTTEAETAVETEVETTVETEAETVAETAALEENDAEKTQSAEETETEAADTEAVEEETETETEDPAVVAAMEEAYAKAAAMIELVKAGDDFDTAVQTIKEDETATANEITFDADDTSIAEGLVTSTNDLEDGTLVETPVETTSGYYVVRLVTNLDREATDERKLEIIEERRTELVANLYTEWTEASEITTDEDVLAGIVYDFSLSQETEASTEAETEEVTEAAETETETEEVTEAAETEVETEVETEEVTEAVETEVETEA